MSTPDRPLSKDLTPGTRLRQEGTVVTLLRRKDQNEPRSDRGPFWPGWWLEGNNGGLADMVIDDEKNGWEILAQEGVVMMWDWKGQPNLARLAEVVHRLSGGSIGITEVDTGGDEYAIVIASPPMTTAEAAARYQKMIDAGGE